MLIGKGPTQELGHTNREKEKDRNTKNIYRNEFLDQFLFLSSSVSLLSPPWEEKTAKKKKKKKEKLLFRFASGHTGALSNIYLNIIHF